MLRRAGYGERRRRRTSPRCGSSLWARTRKQAAPEEGPSRTETLVSGYSRLVRTRAPLGARLCKTKAGPEHLAGSDPLTALDEG